MKRCSRPTIDWPPGPAQKNGERRSQRTLSARVALVTETFFNEHEKRPSWYDLAVQLLTLHRAFIVATSASSPSATAKEFGCLGLLRDGAVQAELKSGTWTRVMSSPLCLDFDK